MNFRTRSLQFAWLVAGIAAFTKWVVADSPRPMVAEYTYPSAMLTTNHVFRLFLSTDISQPMSNWTMVAVQQITTISTNQFTTNRVSFTANPGWNYITMTTSNEWATSDFYAPAVQFNPPQSPQYIRVFKQ